METAPPRKPGIRVPAGLCRMKIEDLKAFAEAQGVQLPPPRNGRRITAPEYRQAIREFCGGASPSLLSDSPTSSPSRAISAGCVSIPGKLHPTPHPSPAPAPLGIYPTPGPIQGGSPLDVPDQTQSYPAPSPPTPGKPHPTPHPSTSPAPLEIYPTSGPIQGGSPLDVPDGTGATLTIQEDSNPISGKPYPTPHPSTSPAPLGIYPTPDPIQGGCPKDIHDGLGGTPATLQPSPGKVNPILEPSPAPAPPGICPIPDPIQGGSPLTIPDAPGATPTNPMPTPGKPHSIPNSSPAPAPLRICPIPDPSQGGSPLTIPDATDTNPMPIPGKPHPILEPSPAPASVDEGGSSWVVQRRGIPWEVEEIQARQRRRGTNSTSDLVVDASLWEALDWVDQAWISRMLRSYPDHPKLLEVILVFLACRKGQPPVFGSPLSVAAILEALKTVYSSMPPRYAALGEVRASPWQEWAVGKMCGLVAGASGEEEWVVVPVLEYLWEVKSCQEAPAKWKLRKFQIPERICHGALYD